MRNTADHGSAVFRGQTRPPDNPAGFSGKGGAALTDTDQRQQSGDTFGGFPTESRSDPIRFDRIRSGVAVATNGLHEFDRPRC